MYIKQRVFFYKTAYYFIRQRIFLLDSELFVHFREYFSLSLFLDIRFFNKTKFC